MRSWHGQLGCRGLTGLWGEFLQIQDLNVVSELFLSFRVTVLTIVSTVVTPGKCLVGFLFPGPPQGLGSPLSIVQWGADTVYRRSVDAGLYVLMFCLL